MGSTILTCSSSIQRVTGVLHVFALIVSLVGMLMQIHAVKSDQPYSLWLPLSLAIMLVLRVPNQICVALRESHGWFSVFGTVLAIFGYIYLTIETNNRSKYFTLESKH